MVIDGGHGRSSFSDFVSRAGDRRTLHQTPIEVRPSLPPRERSVVVFGYGGVCAAPHDLETHRFPRAVPFKKGTGVFVPERRGASMYGARVRGRGDEEEGETALCTVEREWCPIKRRSLPGVGAHDAGACSRGDAG